MEIAAAVRSPDATKFVSHLPVHQDGSCNGLQHYAALGHDQYGAKQVNLVPSDRPQDVYAEVSRLFDRPSYSTECVVQTWRDHFSDNLGQLVFR